MTEFLVDHAPRVRCYECGHHEIFSVCHHCQRPMCDKHSPLAFRQGGVHVRTAIGDGDDARPISKEFAGLGLGRLREAVYHCRDHSHLVRGVPVRWIGIGAGVAALGFLLLFASSTTGLVLMLIGAGLAGVPYALYWVTAANAVRPPLPLVPQVESVDIVERLNGYVRLDSGKYASFVDSVAGQMRVELSANDGHLVLQAYRKKFQLAATDPVSFSGGYIMIEGDVGLAFGPGQPPVLASGTGISLGGDSAADHDLFPVDVELPQCESSLAVDYEILESLRPQEIPLWIVPSMVPASDRRALEVDLHWNGVGAQEQRLSLAMFDLIELEVPASWGNVEGVHPQRVETGKLDGRRFIRWKQIKPERHSDGSLTLRLRFERPITEVAESAAPSEPIRGDDDGARTRLTLSGRLEATFDGLLSGAKGVGVYLPGGGPAHYPREKNQTPVKTQTRVAVSFDASLRSIRYQDDRVVPDENRAEDIELGRNRVDEFVGVVADYRTVAELTNAISADNYYVKSVVEHLPYRDDARAGVVNRVWDIAGRLYMGVFPIDFDINLRGDEVAGAGGLSGKTDAQVTVKGSYVMGTLVGKPDPDGMPGFGADPETTLEPQDGGDELRRRIEETWISLHGRVIQVLGDKADRAGGRRAVTSSPESVHLGEVIELGRTSWPDEAVTVDAVDAVEVPRAETTGGEAFTGRAGELRTQRKHADEAVIIGRISEETHRGIVARIEAELKELGEPS